MKDYISFIVLVLSNLLLGYMIGKESAKEQRVTVTETRETMVDTTAYYAPMRLSELASGTRRYTLPVYRFVGTGCGGELRQSGNEDKGIDTCAFSDSLSTYGTGAEEEPRSSADSAIVELPIIQRHYADSTYEAWVSGPVDPRLDSLRVFAPTTIITRREWKPPKRWHIGITAGYGYGAKGFHPYFGLGITYSIFSF